MNTKDLLKKLSQDKHSSATHITAYTCEALRQILPRLKNEQLKKLLKKIPACQPSMAPLYNLCDALSNELKKGADGERLGGLAFEFLSEMGANVYKATATVAKNIRSGSTILTYSASSLVLESLLRAKKMGKKFRVLISEARPALEGKWAAQKLSLWRIPTTLMTDAKLFANISQADLILLGADALLPGVFVHKIGTNPLVQIAKIQKIPVWVVATREKFLNLKKTKRFKINRDLFDQTPLQWITKVISS